MVSDKKIFMGISIGSYVKSGMAVVAILVGGLNCRTQFLAWRPTWLEIGITGYNFQGGPPTDHSTKVWLQLAQWFLRRRLKCEILTDERKMMAIFQMA
jgi:hypothetical protein